MGVMSRRQFLAGSAALAGSAVLTGSLVGPRLFGHRDCVDVGEGAIVADFLQPGVAGLDEVQAGLFELQGVEKFKIRLKAAEGAGSALGPKEVEALGVFGSFVGFGNVKSGVRVDDVDGAKMWKITTDSGDRMLQVKEGKARVFLDDKFSEVLRVDLDVSERDDVVEVTLKNNFTSGNAVQLGGSLFLTANHVVSDEGEHNDMALVPQRGRDLGEAYRTKFKFRVVGRDVKNDLALLKAEPADDKAARLLDTKGRALIHLGAGEHAVGDVLRSFDQLTGGSLNKDGRISFRGSDFYDDKKKATLGGIFIHGKRKLLEVVGNVIKVDKDHIVREYPESAKMFEDWVGGDRVLSTVIRYNGESGGGFYVKKGDIYELAGILTTAFGKAENISLEGDKHPLRKTEGQNVATLFTSREPIRRLLEKYAGGLEKPK